MGKHPSDPSTLSHSNAAWNKLRLSCTNPSIWKSLSFSPMFSLSPCTIIKTMLLISTRFIEAVLPLCTWWPSDIAYHCQTSPAAFCGLGSRAGGRSCVLETCGSRDVCTRASVTEWPHQLHDVTEAAVYTWCVILLKMQICFGCFFNYNGILWGT